MTLKVLVISDYRPYHSTRPEAIIFIELAKMGVEVDIMTYKEAALTAEFEQVGINVIDFHPEKKFDKQEIKWIREQLIKGDYDIVHLFNGLAIMNGIRAAKGLPVKVVLYRGYTGHIHWYDPTAYLKYLHPRVDMITCNSKGVEEQIQRQLFFNKRKTATINKGHNVDWYKDIKPYQIRQELGIPEDALLLVNVANNRRMKGVPYLLKAIARLPAEVNVHLLLIGSNMDNERNLRIIQQGENENKVHILGFRKDVLNIVAASNAFVLTSIKGESITKSVIEAMALGVTPVISDIPGNRELVVNDESGLIFPSKDIDAISRAIMKLYNNRELCRQLGKGAKRHIEKHLNYKQTAIKMKELYESLAE